VVDDTTIALLVFSGLAAIGGIVLLYAAIAGFWRRPQFDLRFAHGAKSVDCQRSSQRTLDLELEFTGHGGTETRGVFFYFPKELGLTNPQTLARGALPTAVIPSGRFANNQYFSLDSVTFLPEEVLTISVTLNLPNQGGTHKIQCSVHPISGAAKLLNVSINVV
jgi:hypothetical protein